MAQEYGPNIVTDGLVLFLDAADKNSYPGSGTTWTDLSSSGNDATLVNSPTFNSDNCGSIVFDGVDQYATFSRITMAKESATIMGWCYVDDFTTGRSNAGRIFVKDSSASYMKMIVFFDGEYGFETNTNSDPFELSGAMGGPIADSGITTGTFFHFALVFDSSTSHGYVNGDLTDSTGIADSMNLDRIGEESSSSSYPAYMKGKIFNIMIYDTVLSAKEISQNFNAHRSRFGM
jgi:hypothetical protein